MNAFLSKKPKELQGTNIEPDHVIEGLPCVGTSRSTVTNVLATANSELADAKSVSEHDVSLPSWRPRVEKANGRDVYGLAGRSLLMRGDGKLLL